MKLSDILKAVVLSRLVGVDPLEACVLSERATLPATKEETSTPVAQTADVDLVSNLRKGGAVSKQIAGYLAGNRGVAIRKAEVSKN